MTSRLDAQWAYIVDTAVIGLALLLVGWYVQRPLSDRVPATVTTREGVSSVDSELSSIV